MRISLQPGWLPAGCNRHTVMDMYQSATTFVPDTTFGFTEVHNKLDLYSGAIRHSHDKTLRWTLFSKVATFLSCLDDEGLSCAVKNAPGSIGHEGWDNLIAGSVEYLCAKHDVEVPDWVCQVRPADVSWFFPDETNERRYQVPDPVAECAMRGVYISGDHFVGC